MSLEIFLVISILPTDFPFEYGDWRHAGRINIAESRVKENLKCLNASKELGRQQVHQALFLWSNNSKDPDLQSQESAYKKYNEMIKYLIAVLPIQK